MWKPSLCSNANRFQKHLLNNVDVSIKHNAFLRNAHISKAKLFIIRRNLIKKFGLGNAGNALNSTYWILNNFGIASLFAALNHTYLIQIKCIFKNSWKNWHFLSVFPKKISYVRFIAIGAQCVIRRHTEFSEAPHGPQLLRKSAVSRTKYSVSEPQPILRPNQT